MVILHGATLGSKSILFIQMQREAASLIILIPDDGNRDSLQNGGSNSSFKQLITQEGFTDAAKF